MATAGGLMSEATTMTTGEVRFGPWVLDPGQIFLETSFSYGVVNLKPIVPGHVLIISKRICPRLSELTPEEVSDLFTTVHRVGPVIERHYQGDALNIAIQDGVSAGQTVPHVHVHILPRKVSNNSLSSSSFLFLICFRVEILSETMRSMSAWISTTPRLTSPSNGCQEVAKRWLQRAGSFVNSFRMIGPLSFPAVVGIEMMIRCPVED
jgi:diadenosine tetraphosphate (Ap4A) HIT family hydrolase